MVGACYYYWFVCIIVAIIVAPSISHAKPKYNYPDVCRELGNFGDCSSSKLESVPTNIPKRLTHLYLHNNSIKNLNAIDWRNLTQLTVLTLNNNNIETISADVFQHQKHLKILKINHNKLKEIKALTFINLRHLVSLKLKRNDIKELKDGTFYGLMKIKKLYLDYNQIRAITKGGLYGLESLKELSLSHNKINHIDIDSWDCCKHLTYLDLSSNKLESIEAETFRNLGDLRTLILSNNSITFIKENAFRHLPKLNVLNLSYNKIWWTVEDANGVFNGLNDLNHLLLAGNNIKSINENAFVGLRNVTVLNLDHNNITSIQKNSFRHVPLLRELIINTTSLLCDCNLQWFVEWMNIKKFANRRLICAFPKRLQGQSLLNVTSNNLTCDELSKPRLIDEPSVEIMALKGEDIQLSCKAMSNSNSIMNFQWKKDNVELKNVEILKESVIDPDGKTIETNSTLRLRSVNDSDAGSYQCVVSNHFGTTYSQKSTIFVLVYPTFVKKPKNVTVQAGETAKLECAANGEPQPEIAWHKDGGNYFPAAFERRMHVMPEDDVFFIVNAKPIDMGVYSCRAKNAAGTIVTNASLIVQEKPYFVKSMKDKVAVVGELIALQCMAKGEPKPTLTWLKDGQPIARTDRHFSTAEDQLLIIVDTVESDSGIYQCYVNNSLGEEIGTSRIDVKPISDGFNRTNLLEIIIITVVTCAVLTSIIWVVIIYQTRKNVSATQSEMQELDNQMHPPIKLRQMQDNISDHSSCKDSGTGDSVKRSSDDLGAPDEYRIVNENVCEAANSSNAPLLYYPRSTNHDRTIPEEVDHLEMENNDQANIDTIQFADDDDSNDIIPVGSQDNAADLNE